MSHESHAPQAPVFFRRLGPDPRAQCVALENCPDIWELSDGRFALIGSDITALVANQLPPGVGCGAGERVIVVPRALLVAARDNIPQS